MSEVRNGGSLKQLQSLSLDSKLILTRKRINQWVEHWGIENVYLAFSGGKDSTVLKHIIEEMFGNGVQSVFCNTGLEYPEVRRFAQSQDNVITIRPKLSFKDVIEKYGYPLISKEQAQYIDEIRTTHSEDLRQRRLLGRGGRFKLSDKWRFLLDAPFKVSAKCCAMLKKNPFKTYQRTTKKMPFIATMAEESRLRLNAWIRHGCNAFKDKAPRSAPMSFWTEQDILTYIDRNKLSIAPVYGEVKREFSMFNDGKFYCSGCDRTGCMFCLFGVHLENEPNRFQRMKVTHPRQYQYCIEDLGIGKVLDYIKVKYV